MWQYNKDDPNDNMADAESFKYKVKITGKTPDNENTKDVEIIVPLKHFSNFWRTLEMPLINCKVILLLSWSKDLSFQGVYRLSVLSFKNENGRTSHSTYYLPKVEIKEDYNVMITMVETFLINQ